MKPSTKTKAENLREVLADMLATFDNVGKLKARNQNGSKNAKRQPGAIAVNQ